MTDLIIGLCLGMVFFLCTISAYTIGLKHGRLLTDKIVPKVELNPVKAVVEAVEEHKQKKETKQAADDLDEIMSYNTETALKAIRARG